MNQFELTVTVSRTLVLEKLIENRKKHHGIFVEAIERYRERAIRELNAKIDDIKRGKTLETYVRLPIPEDHTDDYNRAIRMMEMHILDDVEMTEATYRCFYDDEWDWKERWVGTTASYTGRT